MPSQAGKIHFGAYLTYSPKGETEIEKQSREFCFRVKRTNEEAISKAIARLEEERLPTFERFINEQTVLVPVPRSRASAKDQAWPAKAITDELVSQGLASQSELFLQRTRSVKKSANPRTAKRPDPKEHYESISCEKSRSEPDSITLIDDVFTRGSTFLGAAAAVRDVFPRTAIAAFALIWTHEQNRKPSAIRMPIKGKIWVGRNGKPIRRKFRLSP